MSSAEHLQWPIRLAEGPVGCGRCATATAGVGGRARSATPTGCARGSRPRRRRRSAVAGTLPADGAALRRAGAGRARRCPSSSRTRGAAGGPVDGRRHRLGLGPRSAASATGSTGAVAGRGVIPTAVALAVDHCFFTVGLHRIEVNIRPENHRVAAGRREARLPRGGHPRSASCTSTATGATTCRSR